MCIWLYRIALDFVNAIDPLHDLVTWSKITYTGEQVAQWDFQNNATAFVLEVPLRNLLTSICNFVPCGKGRAKGLLGFIRHRVQVWRLEYNVKLQQSSKEILLELTNVLKVV